MNSARRRGRRRIEQATAGLAALGVIVTGGAMALAYGDVAASVTANGSTSTASSGTGTSGTASTNSGSTGSALPLDSAGSGSIAAQSGSS